MYDDILSMTLFRWCYNFDDIIKLEDFNFDNIVMYEKSHKNILVYDKKLWLFQKICVLDSIK